MGLDHANSFAHKELLADASFKWGRYPASPDAALNQLLGMKEYELYLPLAYNDGSAIPAEKLDHCRKLLLDEFGGFTHFPQENEGVWKLGGIVFRDKVILLRVLSDQPDHTHHFFAELRIELMRELEQADVLIVEREVTRIC